MTTADIHPDLRRIARVLPRTMVRAATLPLLRAGERLQKPAPSRSIEVLTTASGVNIRLHRPAETTGSGPAMLWIHGGGYVIGSPAQNDGVCGRFARDLGITVAAVQYGRAPEHQYPVALEQCYAALQWLATLPSVDPDRIVIAGGSAGGGLAARLAFLARDRGEISPVAQHLLYPMLDDRTDGPDRPGFRIWGSRSNEFAWKCYLGDADRDQAVPARRTDLPGLPPAWIGVGTLDLFHDEDLAYAQRLRDAGVPCQVDIVPGAFHGFDEVAPKAGVTQDFFNTQCASLKTALGI